MTERFSDKLIKACTEKHSHLALALKPDIKKIPTFIKKGCTSLGTALYMHNKGLIDAVANSVVAIVMPMADYEMYGISGIVAFDAIAKYAKSRGLIVIADGKRGGTKEECIAYAKAYLTADEKGASVDGTVCVEGVFSCDALTVSAYSAADGIAEMVRLCDENGRGIFINSINTKSDKEDDFENIKNQENEEEIYKAAVLDSEFFGKNYVGQSGYSIVGAQVKSTEDAYEVRDINSWGIFLVDADEDDSFLCEQYGEYFNSDDGQGAIVCVSRRIMYAFESTEYSEKFNEETYAEAAGEEAAKLAKKLEGVI